MSKAIQAVAAISPTRRSFLSALPGLAAASAVPGVFGNEDARAKLPLDAPLSGETPRERIVRLLEEVRSLINVHSDEGRTAGRAEMEFDEGENKFWLISDLRSGQKANLALIVFGKEA